ncbi:hypothetical protein [Alteraurantiacibacter aquimixticola]|uniref:Uncharacterized protein n=1 Tax=Alteraurantiacibacter aquimixticola TaxID=2489173 RepID=A0A4T3F1E9_9SPHN|nr:hypothetical protein [Alteraurantiacibacter aquimixticola]TIX50387.1 hypothetical protein E5222_08920 [Alteraurantiacibacter aquimixticola]
MTEEQEPDAEEMEEAQHALDRSIREEIDELRQLLPFAVIPLFIASLFLSLIFGSWVTDMVPTVFVLGGIIGGPIYLYYRRRVESDLPFIIPGHGSFSGSRKHQLLRGGAIVLFLVIVLEYLTGQAIGWARDTLMAWRL